MKIRRKYGEPSTREGRDTRRAGGQEEGNEGGRKAERALAALSLSSWKSLLQRDCVQTSGDIPEMYPLITNEALQNSSLGIPKTMKECLFAYMSSCGNMTGKKRQYLDAWRVQHVAICNSKRGRNANVDC